MPDRSPRGVGIVAHELTHIARTTPSQGPPRFFGDDHHDRDEAVATALGHQVEGAAASIRRSATVDLPVRSGKIGSGPDRAAVAELREAAAEIRVAAAALRAASGPLPGRASTTTASGSRVESRIDRTAPVPGRLSPSEPAVGSRPDATSATQSLDAIVDALEQRVLAEIERRGGRFAGVF